MRASCIDSTSRQVSISKQCELLKISRSTYYYKSSSKQDEKDFELLKQIQAILREHPEKGYRKIWREITRAGGEATEKQVRRVMRRFGLMAVFPGKNMSKMNKQDKNYPYLLKHKIIRYPNQVWSTDITYIKLPSGHVYLMAIIDWYSRKVLSWQVFNTMDAGQYARLLRDTIEQYGCPAIFNTDQGAQFTSDAFTSVLIEYGIDISMDGRGRALDNIRIERLWRSLKYEDIYLKRYETMGALKAGIAAYFRYYNSERLHQGLDYEIPDDMYQSFRSEKLDRNMVA